MLLISEPDFLGFANPYAVQTWIEWEKGSKCHIRNHLRKPASEK